MDRDDAETGAVCRAYSVWTVSTPARELKPGFAGPRRIPVSYLARWILGGPDAPRLDLVSSGSEWGKFMTVIALSYQIRNELAGADE